MRRDAVVRSLQGGEDFFQGLQRICKDDHLLCVSFLRSDNAEMFIRRNLLPRGLKWTQGDEAIDLTIAEQGIGLRHYTPWLEMGQLAVEEGEVSAAWLAGTQPGELRTFATWTFDRHRSLRRLTDEELTDWEIGHSDDPRVEVRIHRETGERIYRARRAISDSTPSLPFGVEDLFRGKPTALEVTYMRARKVFLLKKQAKETGEAPGLPEELDRLERALVAIREQIRGQMKGYPSVHFIEGYVLMALDRHVEAETALRRAYTLEPNSPNLVGELMINLAALGNMTEAIEVGRRHVAHNPMHPLVSLNLASMLDVVGAPQDGLAVLEKFLEEQPGHELAIFMKGIIEGRQKAGDTSSGGAGAEAS